MGKQAVGYRVAPLLVSGLVLVGQPAWAEEIVPGDVLSNHLPATAPTMAQGPLAQPIQVIEVQVSPTDIGVEVILKTADGALETSGTSVVGNTLIAEIPNAVLADGETFQAVAAAEGITLVSVDPTADGLRVTITGADAPPMAEVRTEEQGLVLSITPDTGRSADDSLRLLVTGEQERDYSATQATVGTRTVTPILEVPQSIQVVPESVIEDQNATLNSALRNISGVQSSAAPVRSQVTSVIIRGFDIDNTLINGLRDPTFTDLGLGQTNIERVEVLKGPASVLYGLGDPGGTINVVTKQPLLEPFYELDYTIDNFGLQRPAFDISGPLNADQTLLYRLNGFVEFGETFVDFEDVESRPFIAPTLAWQIDDDTTLTLEANYLRNNTTGDAPSLPAVGTVIDNPNGEIDLDVNLGEPDVTETQEQVTRIGYRLEHQLDDNWAVRSEVGGAVFRELTNTIAFPLGLLPDQRTLLRALVDVDTDRDSYVLNNSVVGSFNTGSVDHQLLVGVELARENLTDRLVANFLDPIDIFDPVYSPNNIGFEILRQDVFSRTDSLGIYAQDQISFTDDLTLVLGGRFDIAGVTNDDAIAQTDAFQQVVAFSPRVGLVYQPSEDVSLYGSYARSFTPQAGQTFAGDSFRPERGTQYELGNKAN